MNRKRLIIESIATIVVPLLLVQILNNKVSPAYLLMIAGIIPSLFTIFGFIQKRVNPIAVLSLIGFFTGSAISFFAHGNPLPLKLTEPIIGSAIGLTFIVSWLIHKPITKTLAKSYLSSRINFDVMDESTRQRVDKKMSNSSLAVGAFLLLHAILKIILALTLSTAAFYSASKLITIVFVVIAYLIVRRKSLLQSKWK